LRRTKDRASKTRPDRLAAIRTLASGDFHIWRKMFYI